MSYPDITVDDHPRFSKTQHCRADECYSFSHTAQWCGRPQPEFCPCPFDYAEGWAEKKNKKIRAARAALAKLD